MIFRRSPPDYAERFKAVLCFYCQPICTSSLRSSCLSRSGSIGTTLHRHWLSVPLFAFVHRLMKCQWLERSRNQDTHRGFSDTGEFHSLDIQQGRFLYYRPMLKLLLRAVHCCLERSTSLECGCLGCFDLELSTCSRIAASARCTFTHFKCAEAD